nr:V-type ATP synthase subunit E [uncultured Merdimonas sp.]
MTIEEKMFHLQTAAMEEARAEGNAIIRQHEEALNGVFEQHCQEAKRQSETRIKAEKVSAKQQLNMAASKAQLELKRELGRTQAELKKKLFAEVESLLDHYMQTEDYLKLLTEYIEKAAAFADGEAMMVYINPTDEDKKEYLEEHTGLTLTVSKEDFRGGIRAVIRGRNILIDHAFKGALESEYQKFIFRGGGKDA